MNLCSIFICLVLTSLNLVSTSTVDPDHDRLLPELIESRGFLHEPHFVVTQDDYILGIHRMINPLAEKKLGNTGKPVLIQCGLLCSGSEFLDNSASGELSVELLDNRHDLDKINFTQVGNNLGFILGNLGYDIWFFQPRGNFYSRNHTTLDPNSDKDYWKFSWDEIATIDLPNTIDYILNLTKQETLAYIGYSQGGTTLFAMLSDLPHYSDKIQPIIPIAPAVRLDNYGGLAFKPILESPMIMEFVKSQGGECFPFFKRHTELCNNPLMKPVCDWITYNFLTINKKQVNQTRFPVQLAHMPSGTSCWNILHYLQTMKSKKFTKFDFGVIGNWMKYRQMSPPVYNLDNVASEHISMIVSIGDHSADPKDIFTLKDLLKSVPWIDEYTVMDRDFDHLDFIMSKSTGILVNERVARILAKYDQ